MRSLLELWNRVRDLFRRDRLAAELDEELRFHRQMIEKEISLEGDSDASATLRARNRLGNATLVMEDTRAQWGFAWLDSLAEDGRCAIRCLVRTPASSLSIVGMLCLAIGITTAMFTIVDAFILHPVPFKNPEELGNLYIRGERGGPSMVSRAAFRVWRNTTGFAGVEGVKPLSGVVNADGGEFRRGMAQVTPGVFDLLGGVRPVRGRLFDASEGRPGSDDRVLISADVWQTLYHSDPSLVGRNIRIDGQTVTIVGILPADFRFPNWDTVIWRAANFDSPAASPADDRVSVYVRFASNVPKADALRLATSAALAAGSSPPGWFAAVNPLGAGDLGSFYERAVPLLSGGVILLFIVLCSNVCTLLLSRFAARGREFATRTALGASRLRLARQAFIESALAGLAGIAAGVGLGWALVSMARAILPQAALLRSLNPLNLDVRAFVATSITGLIVIAVGMLPAIVGTRVDPARSLQLSGRSGSESKRGQAVRRGLLVCQIALSCTLLIGATLLVHSFVNLITEERGVDAHNILVARMSLVGPSFATPESREIAQRSIEEQIRAVPGIKLAAWSYGTPPAGAIQPEGVWQADVPGAEPVKMMVNESIVGSEFFDLFDIPILKGRAFQPSDDPGAVLVSERFAQELWPGIDPIGRTYTFGEIRLGQTTPRTMTPFHVVGLVREVHAPSLDRRDERPQLYVRYERSLFTPYLSLRCDPDCPDTAVLLHRLTAAVPGVRDQEVKPLEDYYLREYARPRATAALAFTFAITALIAAAGGLFSLLNHSVACRRHEFGIRSALGASPANVCRLVWGDGLGVTLSGIAIGTIAGLWLAKALGSLLFDVTVMDPLTWTIVSGVFLLTVAAAAWHPSRAAARTDPALLLRDN